jgi:ParB-like chromosome segregation protein Spo0J
MSNPNVFMVKIENLVLPTSVVARLSRKHIPKLRVDIAREGIKYPLLVRPTNDKGKWLICDGIHRYHIAKEQGIKELPCIIYTLECANEAAERNKKYRKNIR